LVSFTLGGAPSVAEAIDGDHPDTTGQWLALREEELGLPDAMDA
jgi:hypothetical protein